MGDRYSGKRKIIVIYWNCSIELFSRVVIIAINLPSKSFWIGVPDKIILRLVSIPMIAWDVLMAAFFKRCPYIN